jgi:hypothetical protein
MMLKKSFAVAAAFSGLVLGIFAGASAIAKPLYITVPRAFSPTESPVVDVAFGAKEPVELRILKPTDLDAFVSSQSNLRRAYETPATTVNPGRYLSRGLNAVHDPGYFLLRALDPTMRREVSPSLPDTSMAGSGKISHLRDGEPKLVGFPPGMTLVKSQWLNLDLGGDQKDFNVPGFEEWGGESSYQERKVKLDPLAPGLYVLQLVQGRIEGQVVLVVSDMTVQVKQTSGKLLVRVAGRDQQPKVGADVQVFLPRGKGPSGKTGANGEAMLAVADPKILAIVKSGADVAIVDTDFYSTLAISPDVFVYSDRPIYRPGDTVQFRGLLRQPDGVLAQLFKPKKKQISITLLSDGGAAVTAKAEADEFGSFSGQLKIPEGLATGVLRVVADVDGKEHASESRVQEYVKPTFYVELASDMESVKPGDTITAQVHARRYAGGSPKNAKYEYFLYRTVLDSPAWVDDAGMGGQGSKVTYGSQSTTEGALSVPKRLYSSIEFRASNGGDESSGEGDMWAAAPAFDDKGDATISVTVPALADEDARTPFKYSLSVRARDDQGTFANAAKTFFYADSEVVGTIRPSAKVTLVSGTPPTLSIRAASLGGKAYGETDGTVEFVLRTAAGDESSISTSKIHSGADGVWRGPVPISKVGTVVARVTLNDKKGRPWKGETTLIVAGEKGEAVSRVPVLTVDAVDGTLSPGDTAQLVAMLPEGWGPGGKNSGPIWVTFEGTTIFDSKMVNVTGLTWIQKFPVERRFGSAVYASIAYPTRTGRWEERVVPFRILPSERTLSIAVRPSSVEAAPLGKQTIDLRVTDDKGRGKVAQVSVGVVDKAIYALQSEFRPQILSFFYPLVRDNVTSFYSAEFQGYGYGEQLARAGRVHGVEFAAIKPPTKKHLDTEKDTAYWNPSVTTDADGHASVTFDLPSNQTIWTITAVAADASGRFGEGTGEFATRGSLNLVSSLPQFMRAGDKADGSVRISRGQKGDASNLKLELASLGSLTAASNTETIASLKAGDEKIFPIKLAALGVGAGQVTVRVSGGDLTLNDRREVPIRPAALDETIVASAWGGGKVKLELPDNATVDTVELTLGASTVEVVMQSLDELLNYPYGCLEQLIATTVPNVAVYSTIQKVGAFDGLDPDSKSLLAESKSRSVQGLDRILKLEVKGGGFTLWPGETVPQPDLTLIALDGLAYAVDAGLVDGNDPRITESIAWIGTKNDLPVDLDAERAYVLARLQGPKQAARVRALVDHVQPSDLYAVAVTILAAEASGVANEPALRQRIGALIEQSNTGMMNLASYHPDEQVFWHFPMREVGMTAILSHAASFGKVDTDRVRMRLMQVMTEKGDYVSTLDRSTFLLHTLWLLEQDAKSARAMTPPVLKIGGVPAVFVPRGAGLYASLDRSVSKVDLPAFEGVARLKARVKTPYTSAKPKSDGMSVARKYYALRGGAKVALKDGDSVAQGEEVFVELAIDAHAGDRRTSMRSAYYVVEDSIPAGFVALSEDKAYRGAPYNLVMTHQALAHRSFSPERATFFFDEPAWWSDSPRTIGYVLRAQFPGTFVAPPSTVQDMYATAIGGRTAASTLTITPSGSGAR